jgi:hypothetical protein
MDRRLSGGQSEYQPPPTGVDRPKAEHVGKEQPISVGILTEQYEMRSESHKHILSAVASARHAAAPPTGQASRAFPDPDLSRPCLTCLPIHRSPLNAKCDPRSTNKRAPTGRTGVKRGASRVSMLCALRTDAHARNSDRPVACCPGDASVITSPWTLASPHSLRMTR